MSNIIMLAVCLLLGIILQRVKGFPVDAHKALNAFILFISLPALTLLYIPQLQFNQSIVLLVGLSWLVLAGAVLTFGLLGPWIKMDRSTQGALMLTAGLGNTSFVGVPVLEAIYGELGVKTAIIIDQSGTFLALSTAGILIASYYASGKATKSALFKKVLTFPPFIAFVLAIILNLAGYKHHALTEEVLAKLGGTISILALVSVGLQLKPEFSKIKPSDLLLGLGYKLLLAPLLIYLLYVLLLNQRGIQVQISIMEAAMAPMITASILAVENKLNPPLANLMIGVGIPLSFLTLAAWYHLIGSI